MEAISKAVAIVIAPKFIPATVTVNPVSIRSASHTNIYIP
jgi:hypothetical protein